MEETKEVILTLALMLAAGLIAQPIAAFLRLPVMLLLVAAGAILGPSVTGWIDVPLASTPVQVLLTLGVSFILFHGGLQLSARILSRVAIGLGMLVIPGVIITAAIVGIAASVFFDVPVTVGLLIGAALAPTDPAILIPLFERMRIRPKVSQTIIAESALNDPTGAVLALTFAGIVATGDNSVAAPVARLPEGAGDLDRARHRFRHPALARHLERPGRHLARVGRRCRSHGRCRDVLLARLRRGQRLSGRLHRRVDRGQHGSVRPRNA